MSSPLPYRICIACLLVLRISTQVVFSQSPDSDPATPRDISFNRDVRPILAATCFRCHGQDAGHREADLRLDIAKDATAKRDSGTAIVPNHPDQSLTDATAERSSATLRSRKTNA